ncbi:hypothetical protein D3C86_1811010 [compost metagenome]
MVKDSISLGSSWAKSLVDLGKPSTTNNGAVADPIVAIPRMYRFAPSPGAFEVWVVIRPGRRPASAFVRLATGLCFNSLVVIVAMAPTTDNFFCVFPMAVTTTSSRLPSTGTIFIRI